MSSPPSFSTNRRNLLPPATTSRPRSSSPPAAHPLLVLALPLAFLWFIGDNDYKPQKRDNGAAAAFSSPSLLSPPCVATPARPPSSEVKRSQTAPRAVASTDGVAPSSTDMPASSRPSTQVLWLVSAPEGHASALSCAALGDPAPASRWSDSPSSYAQFSQAAAASAPDELA
ncbi:hypothetical protein EJB05_22511, partial [Eragrostis curvula]